MTEAAKFGLILLVALAVQAAGDRTAAAALSCSGVTPGAQQGNVVPPGEFNDSITLPVPTDSCFVQWPANNRGVAGRTADQQKCNSLPNARVLDYLPDHGSNFNLCVFQIVQPVGSGTGASSPPNDKDPPQKDPPKCDTAQQAEAKINVDWVFADRGAKTTYGLNRQMGYACFDAVLRAQAHNPPVQRLLQQCQGWTQTYLAQLGQCGGCALGDYKPGPQQCQCISVKPTGEFDNTGTPTYKVTNSCSDGFRVSVAFIDAATPAPPSSSQAQLVCPSTDFTVRPPQTYRVPSIVAYGLQTAGGALTCLCRDGLCQ